jgi:hypothetical protein
MAARDLRMLNVTQYTGIRSMVNDGQRWSTLFNTGGGARVAM